MNIIDFPEEILAIIINFLSHFSKLNLSSTCHYFFNKTFVYTNSIKFKNQKSKNILKILKKYPNIHTVKFDNSLIFLDYFPYLSNIKKLIWYYDNFSDGITPESHIDPIVSKLIEFNSIEILVVGIKFSEYLFRPFLTHFSNKLKKLYTLIPINYFLDISFPFLTDLSCRLLFTNKYDHIPSILLNFPKLIRLTLFLKTWNNTITQIKNSFILNLYLRDLPLIDETLFFTNLDKIPVTHLHINILNNPLLLSNLKSNIYLKTIKIQYKLIDCLIYYLNILNDSNIHNIYFELNNGKFIGITDYLISLKKSIK